MQAPKEVKCPHCTKLTLFTPENPYRPFCSERCKLIDLGAWADEKYAIPVSPPAENDDENSDYEPQDEQESGFPGSRDPNKNA